MNSSETKNTKNPYVYWLTFSYIKSASVEHWVLLYCNFYPNLLPISLGSVVSFHFIMEGVEAELQKFSGNRKVRMYLTSHQARMWHKAIS